MKNKRLLATVGLLFIFIVLPMFLAWNFVLGPVLDTTSRFRALLGKPKSDVIAALGEPEFRVTADSAKKHGVDFSWHDMGYQPVPDRPVHKEVLLYRMKDRSPDTTAFAVYIFISNDDRVEG